MNFQILQEEMVGLGQVEIKFGLYSDHDGLWYGQCELNGVYLFSGVGQKSQPEALQDISDMVKGLLARS